MFALVDTKRDNETSYGRFNYTVHRIDFTYLQLRSHDFSRTQITSSGHFRGSGSYLSGDFATHFYNVRSSSGQRNPELVMMTMMGKMRMSAIGFN